MIKLTSKDAQALGYTVSQTPKGRLRIVSPSGVKFGRTEGKADLVITFRTKGLPALRMKRLGKQDDDDMAES